MANHLAIATVTEALRQRLAAAIDPVLSGVQVETRRPEATDSPQASQVTIFLFRVSPNAALRNSDLPARTSDGLEVRRRPRVALDLHYLLSFSGDEQTFVPQRMLGASLSVLHSVPSLSRTELENAATDGGPALAGSDIARETESVRFTLSDLSLDELSRLWSVFFQTPYRLSVVYAASVVLIEADIATRAALPVRQGRAEAVPLRRPEITGVSAAGDVHGVVGAAAELEIVGRALRGRATAVRFDGGDPVPVRTATDRRITAGVTGLTAGVHGVQVTHEILLGDPAVAHRGGESETAAFVLRPAVTVTADAADLVATFDPPLRAGQRVRLLLNEDVADAPAFHRLEPAAEFPDGATSVRFPRGSAAAATYLARAQVDAAESPVARVVLP
ncbi:DUF4255 domain-containing protein [Actinoplanes sp. DH11]|uniref:DUF4255 domain-containing protein n=1 Tax=Actinoplanes sp. DH11 TaxID=2857011 RepID=UPI001E2C59D2|nr:DUF4255 domain-containing protein [Actinoplanes sp. DH11]